MLAPPPEGTFDIENVNFSTKSSLKDSSPERIPLVAHENLVKDTGASKQQKVRSIAGWVVNYSILLQIQKVSLAIEVLQWF